MLTVTAAAALAEGNPYTDDIDIFFDCTFPKPYGEIEYWVTVTGQDGTAYRFGALTYFLDGEEVLIDATLYPGRMEADEYKAGFTTLAFDVATGVATFQPTKSAAPAQGQCKVRQ